MNEQSRSEKKEGLKCWYWLKFYSYLIKILVLKLISKLNKSFYFFMLKIGLTLN